MRAHPAVLRAHECVCVGMHGPIMCVHVCVFSGPFPTITVSVHYSLWAAKIIINRKQRWTEGNERLVGGATEAEMAQHFTFRH